MDFELLENILKSQGINHSKLALLLKHGRPCIIRKLRGESDFTVSEITRIKQVLNIDDETMIKILFGKSKK